MIKQNIQNTFQINALDITNSHKERWCDMQICKNTQLKLGQYRLSQWKAVRHAQIPNLTRKHLKIKFGQF